MKKPGFVPTRCGASALPGSDKRGRGKMRIKEESERKEIEKMEGNGEGLRSMQP